MTDAFEATALFCLVALGCLLVIAMTAGPSFLRRCAVFFLSRADALEAYRITRKASLEDWRDKLGLTPVPDEPVTEKHA